MEELKDYLVQAAAQPDLSDLAARPEKIQAMKDATHAFKAILDDFAAEYPGQVEVDPNVLWLTSSIAVRTTPALADEIAKLPGVGKVWKDEPLQILLESAGEKPAAPLTPPPKPQPKKPQGPRL